MKILMYFQGIYNSKLQSYNAIVRQQGSDLQNASTVHDKNVKHLN